MDYNINFPHLGIFLDHVGKQVMIGNFAIAYYGIVIACGMMTAIVVASYVAKKIGVDPDAVFDLALFVIVFGVAGARLYFVIFRWDLYKDNLLSIFNLRAGGLAIYGGIIVGFITALIFCKVRKLKFSLVLDVLGFGVPIGQLIGRWGNFFNREAFGGYTDGLLAMQLPVSAVRANEITAQQWENVLVVDGIEYIQVHPTFLYESLWNLSIVILLFFLLKHRKFNSQLFLTYICLYGLGRFWIEGLRTDQLIMPGIGYPVSQALAAVLFVVAGIWILAGCILASKKSRTESENSETTSE